MKPRKLNGKLSLNKTTISNLNNEEKRRLKGGIGTDDGCTEDTCHTCESACGATYCQSCLGSPCTHTCYPCYVTQAC